MERFLFGAAFSMSMAGAVHAEVIPGSDFGYGNWSGAAYTSEKTGAFSHCAMSAEYLSGDTLYFSVNSDATVGLAVQSPGLKLEVGSSFPVAIYVDRRRPFYGTGFANGTDFALLTIPDFDAAMDALKRGRTMVVESAVGSGTYNLTGTFRALEEARQCAIRHYRYTAAPTPSQPAIPPQLADRTLLFQVATEMISVMGVSDFRYLSESETADFGGTNAVFWVSDEGVFGGVLALPLEGETLRDTDAGDIDFLSRDCSGEIATRVRALSGEVEAREVHAFCVEPNKRFESLLTKALVGDIVLYTLLTFDESYSDPQPSTRQELSEDVAVRAAAYFVEHSVTQTR